MKKVYVFVAMVALMAAVAQAAPTTYMDATLHNGALTAAVVDYWSNPSAVPAGWTQITPTAYTAGGGTVKWTMITSNGTVVNNTGESVLANQQYTIQADLGGFTGYPATVKVYATQNANGTGTKALLASVTRMGNDAVDGYNLFTVSSTGTGVGSSYAGYYIQVALEGTGYYDNIIVTSDAATSMTYVNETLHNGALTAAVVDYWSNPSAVPAGWTQITPTAYTAGGATTWTMITSNGTVVNNTGEVVLANQQFTIQADLGGFTGYAANVKVYATQNANGTGDKALLASLTRMGNGNVEGYNLFTVSNTGTGVRSIYVGYYIQVALEGSGYYDNIVVTSDVATSMTYMNETLHNGALTATAGNWADGHTPTGWAESSPYYVYQTALQFASISSAYGFAFNNTGEKVQPWHKYTVSADLGGTAGKTAVVRVYATQNSNGTGAKVLLADVSRLEVTGSPTWTVYHVTGTTGSPTTPNLATYYVQVVLLGGGAYYDNITVTSEKASGPEPEVYMSADFHNGALTSQQSGGFWWDIMNDQPNPLMTPAGWVETSGYMFTGYALCEPPLMPAGEYNAQAGTTAMATNNTGEIVPASHAFTVSADMGGGAGANAIVRVYATEHIDGTGYKFLLADVSRAGLSGDGYNLYTVKGAPGSPSLMRLAGYYVQVVLGGGSGGYYDNIVVTSEEVPAPTTQVYMEGTFHNGSMDSVDTAGDWSDPCYVSFEWSATNEPNVYTASSGFILFDGHGQTVTNNTGEVVLANHKFKIQADLGGVTGGTAQAFVYATENADGTGAKVLLTEVGRPGNTADGYTLFTVSGTQASATPLSLEGYYVQVVLKTLGDAEGNGNCYYDNIVVTSEVAAACGDSNHLYPSGDLNTDCYVDLKDVKVFAGLWLASGCVTPGWCGGADLNHDASVKFNDFAMLAAHWLDCTDPNSPCSYNP